VPSTTLKGDAHHLLAVQSETTWSHIRLDIYPDGGIARLRVYGEVIRDWKRTDLSQPIDIAALENGGRIIACNDSHFGSPWNLLAPGRGKNMGDGWETRRRREPGNDWVILALGHAGTITRIEVDTAHFKGNYPDRCSIQAARNGHATDESLVTQSMFWPVLLAEQKLEMDRCHVFDGAIADLGTVTHVRFNIFPDGGVSRLRLFGRVAAEPDR
jgi:allantoicase